MGFYSIFIFILNRTGNEIIVQSCTSNEEWTIHLKYDSVKGIIVVYEDSVKIDYIGTEIIMRDKIDTHEIYVLLVNY